MLTVIVSTIEGIVSTFVYVFAFFSTTGRILAYLLTNASEIVVRSTSVIADAAVLFYEDVKFFIADMDYHFGHFIKMFNNGLNNSIDDIGLVTQSISSFIVSVIERSKYETTNFFDRIGELFVSSAIGLRDLFVLIGDSAWMLIMLLPNLIIFTGKSLLNILSSLLKTSAAITTLSYRGLLHSARATVMYFASIPFQSLLGLLAICVAIHQRRRIYQYVKICIHMFYRSILYLLRKFIHFWISTYSAMRFLVAILAETLRMQSLRPELISNEGLPDATDDPQETNEKNLCVICYDQPKSVVLLPCRHLCLCRNCLSKLKIYRRECPMCRETFRQAIQVYS